MPDTKGAADNAAPPTATPEPTYGVTIRLQQGLPGGDQFVHWPQMPEARVWALLRDEVAFLRFPATYCTHPQGESKFLNRDQILEIHLFPAWPYPDPW